MNPSLLVKLAVVAVLSVVLLVPVNMIQGLVAERQARRNEAVSGIAEGWGKRQTIAGPYLVVPYEWSWTEVIRETIAGKLNETRKEHTGADVIHVPASSVEWTVDADITEKARGIYKARLYGARLTAQGTIEPPVRSSYEQAERRYKWGTPRLVVGVSDPGGIRAARDVSVNDKARTFEPGTLDAALVGGLNVPLPDLKLTAKEAIPFSFTLEVGGSEAFALAPLGADARVTMHADWPHPSFQGRFLPARHEITPSGFSATWQVSRFAQASTGPRINDPVFVSFVEPAGLYQRLERASKYGFLFLGLTFAAIVLIEILRRVAVHPVQYALVGLALAIFFLLLTALSEHIAFAYAYVIASSACVGLITVYLVRVLRSVLTGCGMGAAIAGLYGMLYALLQAEDYSLLGGSVLLFGLLATLMLATRKVDWYALTGLRATSSIGPANPG